MPNRMIKETIRTSRSVNALSDFLFRVWLYLITYVDDYGRGSADPELLKGIVFPRRKGITEQQLAEALTLLANSGMITLYEVDGESYFCFPNWSKHQRIQTKKSKFPDPPKVTVSHRESPPETKPNQTKRETETETETETKPKPNSFCGKPGGKGESEGENQRRPAPSLLSGEAREQRIREIRDNLQRYKRLGFPTDQVYRMAEAEGITREEIDAGREGGT